MNNNLNNSQISNKFEQKYNPLKDASFWVAFVLGGGLMIVILVVSAAKGSIHSSILFQPPVYLNLLFLICWEVWIILKKGKKRSLLVGFILALIVTIAATILTVKILSTKKKSEFNKLTDKSIQEAKQEYASSIAKELQTVPQAYIDTDSDGLTDNEEKEKYKTDSTLRDTDKDGLADYEEIFIYKTNPTQVDTDGDGYADGQEVNNGYSPYGDGKLEPLKSAVDSIIYLEHAFGKGDIATYQDGIFYSDGFKLLIRDDFNTDFDGYKIRFKNKVFLPSFRDGIKRIDITNEQKVDDQHAVLDYKVYETKNGQSRIMREDKSYMIKVNDRWLIDIGTEFNAIKGSDVEKWRLIKDIYSVD